MRKQKGIIEIVLVVLLVAVIGVAGYFYLQSRNTQEKPGAKWFVDDEETLRITSTPSPDPTADWKTYKGDKFSFLYPPAFTVKENQKDFLDIRSQGELAPIAGINVDARFLDYRSDYEDAVVKIKEGLKNPMQEAFYTGVKISGVVGPGFGEGTKVVTVVSPYPLNPLGFDHRDGAITAEYIDNGDSERAATFDQILSTFRFD